MRADGNCSSCNAPIRWAITQAGKRMPLNPSPVQGGNVFVTGWQDDDGHPLDPSKGGISRATPLIGVGKAASARAVTPYAYVAHFVTCKNAARHRKH